MGERDDNQILVRMRRGVATGFDGDRRVQPALPRVELRQALGGRRRCPRRRCRRPRARTRRPPRRAAASPRQQPRRDRKILVMRPRQRLARRVGARERLGPSEDTARILVRSCVTLFAAVVGRSLLLVVAASLATTLQMFRRRRQRARDSERALGRTIIAEIPTDDDLRAVQRGRAALLLRRPRRSTRI